MKQLDITNFTQTGEELHDAITAAVKETQGLILQPYPSEILMTPYQYNQLALASGMDTDTTDAKDRMITTKYNVMEVRLKGVGDVRL